MDFGQFDARKKMEEGEWLTLKDPYGEPTDAKIKLVGTDSKAYKRHMHQLADLEKKRKNGLKTAEIEEAMIDTYVSCIVDVENCSMGKQVVTVDNKDLLRELVSMSFVVTQINEFLGDYTSFLSR